MNQPRVHWATDAPRHSDQHGRERVLAGQRVYGMTLRSITYEEVHVHADDTARAAHKGLERYLTFYNQTRPHQALDGA